MQHPQSNDRTRNAGFVRGPDVISGSSGHGLADFGFVHQRRPDACVVDRISIAALRCLLLHPIFTVEQASPCDVGVTASCFSAFP